VFSIMEDDRASGSAKSLLGLRRVNPNCSDTLVQEKKKKAERVVERNRELSNRRGFKELGCKRKGEVL